MDYLGSSTKINTSPQQSALRMNVSISSQIYEGKTFIVQFSINRIGNIRFIAPTFTGIDILCETCITTKRNTTEYTFFLRANKVGEYVITPASAKIDDSIINSSSRTIFVNPADSAKELAPKQNNAPNLNNKQQRYQSPNYQQPNHQTTNDREKNYPNPNREQRHIQETIKNNNTQDIVLNKGKKTDRTIGWIFGIMLLLFIFIMVYQCSKQEPQQVHKEYSDDNSDESLDIINESLETTYDITYYRTGDKPFESVMGCGRYDKNTQNSLLIKNGSDYDAVVFLESLSGRACRHVYVRKGDNYKMKNIPYGKYIIKILQGNNWNCNKSNGESAPMGGFMEDVFASKSKSYDPFDYPDPSSGNYCDYEVTLYKVTNGNFQTQPININELF